MKKLYYGGTVLRKTVGYESLIQGMSFLITAESLDEATGCGHRLAKENLPEFDTVGLTMFEVVDKEALRVAAEQYAAIKKAKSIPEIQE